MLGTKDAIEFRLIGNSVPEAVIGILRSLFPTVIVDETIDAKDFFDSEESKVIKEIETRMTPGSVIRADRTLRNWTQAELAEKLGVHKQVVSELERDKRTVSKEMAKKLGKVFNMPPESYFRF